MNQPSDSLDLCCSDKPPGSPQSIPNDNEWSYLDFFGLFPALLFVVRFLSVEVRITS
jgi:hypothetical protein